MKSETLDKMVALIYKADEDEVFELIEAIVSRRRTMRAEAARDNTLTIGVGDKVQLVNIKPKYLQNMMFVVEATPTRAAPTKFRVRMIDGWVDPRATRRFTSSIRVPADCVKLMEKANGNPI